MVAPFDFADLPAAEAAASDGDTILVRAGVYTPLQTSKALGIRFDAGTNLLPGAFVISNLPPGASSSVVGLPVSVTPFGTTDVLLQDNLGRVHLDRATTTSCNVVGCAHVTFAECTIGGFGLQVFDSTVFAQGCTITGNTAGTPTKLSSSTAAVRAVDADLTLAQCVVTGGQGGGSPLFGFPDEPAIDAVDSDLRIGGDATSVYSTAPLSIGATPVAALRFQGGTLQISPTITLLPQPGGLSIEGPVTMVPGRPVALTADGAGPGSTVTIRTISDAGDILAAFVALPGDLLPTSGGPFGLDVATHALLATTTQGPSEVWALPIVLPPVAELEGLAIAFQAARVPAGGGAASLSNHAVVVLVD